jgi:hypothetical protein
MARGMIYFGSEVAERMYKMHAHYISTRSEAVKRKSIKMTAVVPYRCPESTDKQNKPSLFHKEKEPI